MRSHILSICNLPLMINNVNKQGTKILFIISPHALFITSLYALFITSYHAKVNDTSWTVELLYPGQKSHYPPGKHHASHF